MNKVLARRPRALAVVAHPAVCLLTVVAMAFALSSFGPTPVVALAASTTPVATASTDPVPTSTPTSVPGPSVVPGATLAPVPSLTLVPTATLAPTPSLTILPAVAPGDHDVLARVDGPTFAASYLSVDTSVRDASPFQTFRVRFQMDNPAAVPLTASPQLEYRPVGSSAYIVVPEKPQPGIPLTVAREWVPNLGGGSAQGPIGADIAPTDLLLGSQAGVAVSGHHSMGANPDQPITLTAGTYTEEEFTVQLTVDAQYLTGYQLRITDSGTAMAGTEAATITLGSAPALQLSPGQLPGVTEAVPQASNAAGVAYPLLVAPLAATSPAPAAASAAVVSSVNRPDAVSYPLVVSSLIATSAAASDIHGPYSMTTSACAVCHATHTAQGAGLMSKASQGTGLMSKASQSTLCFMCHDGIQSSTDVKGQYNSALPANVPSAGEYYSHDALIPATSTESDLNELANTLNRSSQCSNCHNAHQAASTDGVQTTAGWTAPGQLSGVSGVAVSNRLLPGAAPAYTPLDGVISPVTLEYQLCFKCHSSFTKLLSPTPGKPSTDALDVGAEFNPANASFHPIEAVGTNSTPKMAGSLAGTSPYKLWNFTTTSTIRCLNCHASATTPTASPALDAGGDLSVHTSSNRGILLQNYQDRVLPSSTAPYSATNFALCYTCHAEQPFSNSTKPYASVDTNFSLHGLHLTGLAGMGAGGTNIDTAGDGQGNALCAECHFRTHSTTYAVDPQQVDATRLVNFAPDVTPYNGTISWTPNSTGGGSCTLTCHGKAHDNLSYN